MATSKTVEKKVSRLITFWEQQKPAQSESDASVSKKKLHSAPTLKKESPPKRRKLTDDTVRARSSTMCALPSKKEQKEKKSSSKADSADKQLAHKRREATQEILSSERSYVESLKLFVENFLEPLKDSKSNLLSEQDRNTIFCGIETVLHLNKSFLQQLETRMADFNELTPLADIFLSFMPHFKMYTQYCHNYHTALQTMTNLSNESAKFRAFIKKAEMATSKRFIDLLIMPVQRVPRYVMLLQAVLQYTKPDHPDYSQLRKALEEAQNAANVINEKLREAENRSKVIAIAERFDGTIEGEDLVQPHRQFIRDGVLAYKDPQMSCLELSESDDEIKQAEEEKGKIYFFLFNDLVLLAQCVGEGKNKQLTLESRLDLATTWVKNDDKDATCFHLVSPRGTASLRCQSVDEKQAWIDSINETINTLIQLNRNANEERQRVSLRFDEEANEWVAEVVQAPFCNRIEADEYREHVLSYTQQQLNTLLVEQAPTLSKLKLTPKKSATPRKSVILRMKESFMTPQKKEKRKTQIFSPAVLDQENALANQLPGTPMKLDEYTNAHSFLMELQNSKTSTDGISVMAKHIDFVKQQLSELKAKKSSPATDPDSKKKRRTKSSKHISLKLNQTPLVDNLPPPDLDILPPSSKFNTIREEPTPRKRHSRKDLAHRRRQSIMVPSELSRSRVHLEDVFK